MIETRVEMRFCRRCGSPLTFKGGSLYRCEQGHNIFLFAAAAVALLLTNANGEVLILERAIDPGKGKLDIPGGFCENAEDPLDAVAREMQEETGLTPDDYSPPEFVTAAMDPYQYAGETPAVLAMVYKATVKGSPRVVPGDDAASAAFVPIQSIDLAKVQFSVIRASLAQLQKAAA